MNKIVEVEGKLYIVLSMVNREDMGSCSYDRIYKLYPYVSELPDELVIEMSRANIRTYHETGIEKVVKERKDKIPYQQYGYSKIRGRETILLERKYPEPINQPTK